MYLVTGGHRPGCKWVVILGHDFCLPMRSPVYDRLCIGENNRFSFTTEKEAADGVAKLFKELRDYYKRCGDSFKGASLPWTEGLFRYKMEEIDGVVINTDSAQSYANGYFFSKIVEKFAGSKCQFYKLTSTGYTELVDERVVTEAAVKVDKQVLQDIYSGYCKA